MAVRVFNAATRLCEKSGWTLTNLQIQKLLYLAHMVHLGDYDAPLITEKFEAWNYGPVQPDLYHAIKVYGSSPVKHIGYFSAPVDDNSTEAKLLDKAYDELRHRSPSWLVAVTHWEKGAWARFYKSGMTNIVIPNSAILQEYRDRTNGNNNNQGG